MGISHELLSQFAKLVTKNDSSNSESTVYGTIVVDGSGNKYVKLYGSDQLTPLSADTSISADSSAANFNEGERVSVLIKNHTATITGNVSSPAARSDDVEELGNTVSKIQEFDILLADQVQANEAYFKKLIADKATLAKLTASEANIIELIAKSADIDKLLADKISVTDLIATKIDTDVVIADTAIIERLKALDIDVLGLVADKAVIRKLIADDVDLNSVEAKNAYLKYATVDFANIGEAAIEKLFSDSGIIKDIVVSDGHITGELVGVTIKGDLIEAGTLKADRLVVKGSDGNYYKLNTDFAGMPGVEPVEEDAIHGSVIVAKSITAEKVSVNDLVAFDATIGGFNITTKSIYSGAKRSVNGGIRGVYMDSDGQLSVGDSNNYLKYYKDTDGKYKLAISASDIVLSASGKTVEEAIADVEVGARNLIRNSKNLIFKKYYFVSDIVTSDDGDGNITWVKPAVNIVDDGDGNITISHDNIVTFNNGNGNVTAINNLIV